MAPLALAVVAEVRATARGTAILRRVLAVTVLTGSLLLIGVSGVSAASTPLPKPIAPTNQIQPAQWAALKAQLNANTNVTKTVSVLAGTRTYTYTMASGSSVVLTEPAAAAKLSVKPNIAFGGCGWFQLCLYLNRQDQYNLWGAGAVAEGIIVCALLAPLGVAGILGCAGVTAALFLADAYLANYGFCSNLQVEVVPWVGSNLRCQ